MAVMVTGGVLATPMSAQAVGADDSTMFGDIIGDTQAEQQFGNLQTKLKGFAVVILLLMLVIAGIMAAMQKVQMAINVAIAAIILFGGSYVILLLAQGLGAAGTGP